MTYNANDIIQNNVIIESKLGGKKAQVGYDLSVCNVERISAKNDVVFMDEDSKIHDIEYAPVEMDDDGCWMLAPNTQYAVTFDQGCNFHNNEFGRIISRSSLNRAGIICLGVIFDPGFVTDHIGCTLYTGNSFFRVHNHARLAQLQVFETNPLEYEDLYNGRWQGMSNHA